MCHLTTLRPLNSATITGLCHRCISSHKAMSTRLPDIVHEPWWRPYFDDELMINREYREHLTAYALYYSGLRKRGCGAS